jgi:hypothetical protein
MSLSKIITGQMVGAAKNAFKMEIVVDKLKDELINVTANQIEEQIPIPLPFDTRSALKGEEVLDKDLLTEKGLNQIQAIPEPLKAEILTVVDNIEKTLNDAIKQKNLIQGALETLLKPIQTLSKLIKNLSKVVTTLNTSIKVLKVIPLPTSVPPGVGIPSSIIIGFADGLSGLKIALDKLDGPISGGEEGIDKIQKLVVPIAGKLKLLDPIFSSSTTIIIIIRTLLTYGPLATQQQIDEVSSTVGENLQESLNTLPGSFTSQSSGVWVRTFNSGNGISESPTSPPPTPPSPFTSKNGDIWKYFSSNEAANAFLLSQLTPPNNNPLIYKGYKLEIENDPNNKFTFASRRIRASFILTEKDIQAQNTTINYQLRLVNSIIYNIPDEGYSFSSSVQSLIQESYYEIDQFIDGEESIQKKINTEYIYDSKGIAVGRYPGRLGYSQTSLRRSVPTISIAKRIRKPGERIDDTVRPPEIITPRVGQLAINYIMETNLPVSSTSLIGTLTNYGTDTFNPSGLIDTFENATPYIFESYLELYPNSVGKFFIEKTKPEAPQKASTISAGGLARAPVKGLAPPTKPPTSPVIPPPQGALYPFNVSGGYPGELRNWQVPNSNPTIYQTYRYDFVNPYTLLGQTYFAKWTLISTSPSGKGG